jgi:hypothetical protein
MRMRAVGVPVRRFLFLSAVAVRMPVVVSMSMTVGLRDRMAAWIPLMPMSVVMVMGWRGISRLWNPALFAHLRRLGHFVIVLSSASFRMGYEPLE